MPSRDEQLGEIIAAFLNTSELGDTPNRDALLHEHPELADDLRSFFANHDQMPKNNAGEIEPTLPPSPKELTEPAAIDPTMGAAPPAGDDSAPEIGVRVAASGVPDKSVNHPLSQSP